jgi:hypothetical protein
VSLVVDQDGVCEICSDGNVNAYAHGQVAERVFGRVRNRKYEFLVGMWVDANGGGVGDHNTRT